MEEEKSHLKDKTAIVTGSGTGIGFEIAMQLLQGGANVVVNDIDESLVEEACRRLGHVEKCIPIVGDAGEIKVIDQMISMAVQRFGSLDFAIANAGITSFGDFSTFSEDQFDQLVSLNLKGTYFLAQRTANQLKEQKSHGAIVLMSSVTGILSHPFLAAYGMTKAAISNLAKNLVIDLAKDGIRINAIAPGAVATERTMGQDPHYDKHWGKSIPTGRVSTPADIAAVALFLLSPAAHQINGQTITVDGGITTLCIIPDDVI